MFNTEEFKQWFGKGSLPDTLSLAFNGSSDHIKTSVEVSFKRVNAAFSHYAATMKDERMSKSERAKALKEGQDFINGELTRSLSNLRRLVDAEENEYSIQRKRATEDGISDEFALQLAAQIREIGGNNADVIISDMRFIKAINRVPAAIAGLTPEQVQKYTDSALARHMPDVVALGHSANAGARSVDRLDRVAMDTAGKVAESLNMEDLKATANLRSFLAI